LLVGASRTDINDIGFGDDIKQTNQKLGVKWQTSDDLSIRAASFRTLKHPIQTEQTLEPTNIFGFIQFYDDFTSTDAQNRGLGLDYKIGNNFYLGEELLERQLNTPVITSLNTDFIQSNEDISTLYLNWTHNFWSANLKLIAEDFQRTQIIGFPIANRPLTLKTERLPLEIRYSSKIGLSVALTATQVEQKATFEIEPFPMAPIEILRDQDDFTILDIELNYKFLNNRAYIAVEIKNAGDEKFRMQDTNFQDNSPKPYRFTPEKSTLIKLGLYF
jgi:hypothetical protein